MNFSTGSAFSEDSGTDPDLLNKVCPHEYICVDNLFQCKIALGRGPGVSALSMMGVMTGCIHQT